MSRASDSYARAESASLASIIDLVDANISFSLLRSASYCFRWDDSLLSRLIVASWALLLVLTTPCKATRVSRIDDKQGQHCVQCCGSQS